MTRSRLAVVAAPVLATSALTLGSRCTDSAHALFRHLGVVHADAGCGSGMALGPSLAQLIGITLLIAAAAAAGSTAVREAIDALLERLTVVRGPVRMPVAVPVTAVVESSPTWGWRTGAGSRDPPRI